MSPVQQKAISELRCAAQIHDKHGNVYKFDDIGCMLRFSRALGLDDAAFYVTDCTNGKDWLRARQAIFVKSEAVSRSIVSGLGAFRSRSSAEEFAAENHGRIVTFQEVQSDHF